MRERELEKMFRLAVKAVLDDPDMIEQIIREIREYGIADEDVLGDIRKVGGMI